MGYGNKEHVTVKVDQGLKQEVDGLTSQLADIAINPRKNGAVFDGVADDSLAIQTTIDEVAAKGGGEVLLTGLVGIGSTIEIKSGVALNCVNAEIRALSNVNIIEFNRNTKIKGNLKIDVSGIPYTSSILHFDGSKRLSYRDIFIDTIFLYGYTPSGMGNAIHFECSSDVSDIAFVQFKNVIIRGFEKGLFLDAPPLATATANYVTGNIFGSLVISDCDYYIYGTGDGSEKNTVDGNSFVNFQLQYNTRAKEMIHLEGGHNHLKGFIWDSAGKNVDIVNLTSTSDSNYLEIHGSNDVNNYINSGNNNYIKLLDEFYDAVHVKAPSGKDPQWMLRFEGEYQDILHKSNLIHSVSELSGTAQKTSGSINDIFDGMSYRSLQLNLDGDLSYSFEITFDATKYTGNTTSYLYSGLKNLGFSFLYGRAPKQILVDVTSNTGEVKSTTLDLVGREFNPYFNITRNSINGLASHIAKIKVTLIGQQGVNVIFGRMYANSFFIGGNKYLSNAGGVVAGDLNMIDSYLLVGGKTTQPANVEGHHRKMVIVKGGTGVADKLMICLKQADDTYQWVQIQ